VLKQRIQLSMILVLVVSFLVIGGGMTLYVIGQYNESNRRLIEEKTGALLTDIHYKLSMHDSLSRNWSDHTYRSLDELLIKFSYVFNTDINLYGPEGKLLASSRPEVYEFSLIGRWMNPLAFNVMHNLGRPSFVHRESIEGLGFLSSYIPVFNQDDRLIAYLNLPYFSKQSQIRNEVSTIVVAMLNAYLIVILFGVFLAVLIANQVTRPLRLIQEKLAGLRFGRRNLQIEYRRSDEIGQLVKEYNRMVSELQESADKLARSERELAWREMARQIAHEIKNPLTPMKLSVQHLRRAWKDEAPNLGEHIDKVTRTLIDQIDNLSAIASEFSRFAKMPGTNFEQIDLVAKFPSITALYEESCHIRFEPDPGTPSEVWVLADKEQILQVFNNLIRNAIQAVPDGVDPRITVSLGIQGNQAVIRVSDNGSGIPEELRDRMFEPNFTTKSSGMGLGLAISKRIIEGSGGEISFETTPGHGTTFRITLPLYAEE
ncbi:MAG: ATP-binding protein, partial [Bacteroidales bacterium]